MRSGRARSGRARHGTARRCLAWFGEVRQGIVAGPGKARQGLARRGEARLGKATAVLEVPVLLIIKAGSKVAPITNRSVELQRTHTMFTDPRPTNLPYVKFGRVRIVRVSP